MQPYLSMQQHLSEILHKTTHFFRQKGLEKPRLEAELLLSHVLKCKRLDLYLNFDKLLSNDILDCLRPLVKRRGAFEPWQYIVGGVEFAKAFIKTDTRALIPRPETEYLYELLLDYYQASALPQRIADLGTGTGALAIALSQAFPKAEIWAVDDSEAALSLAQENIKAQGLSTKIQLLQSNWCEKLRGSFDLIVSNPPYLSHKEWESAQPEVRIFEPKSALVSENEGLACLEVIIQEAFPMLSSGGLLVLETGLGQHARLSTLALGLGYAHTQSYKDLSKHERYLWLWKGQQGPSIE